MATYLDKNGLDYYDEKVQTKLNNKVDKVSGKGLSTNDYTTTEKNKLSGIASGAEVNVQSDWNVTDDTSDAYIKNKPTIPDEVKVSKTQPSGSDWKLWVKENELNYNDNGTVKTVQTLDNLPVGAVVDYEGTEVPQGWEQVSDGTVLYDNASGTGGNITLSDNINNYNRIEIYYYNSDWGKHFFYTSYLTDKNLTISDLYVQQNGCDLFTLNVSVSNTTLTRVSTWFKDNAGSVFSYNPFRIKKVIGYK